MLQVDAYDPLFTTNKVSTSKYYQTKSLAPNFFAGFDNGENFKIELGYKQSETSKNANDSGTYQSLDFNASIKHKLKTQTLSLDFRPYAKINDNLLAYGIIGVSYYKNRFTESGNLTVDALSYSSSDTVAIETLAPTIGFGAEYKIAGNFFTRVQAKYSHINQTFKYEGGDNALKIKSAVDLAAGVGLYF